MFEFLKSIFGLGPKPVPVPVKKSNYETSHDTIDYDGMGNQGRFPVEKNFDRRKKR